MQCRHKMSKEQLDEFNKELSEISPEDQANERMLISFQIRFWKQRAWRAEQQRDREILARKEIESKLDRFKELTQEHIEEMLNSLKNKKIVILKAQAEKLMGLLPWLKAIKEEEAHENLDAKVKFWRDLIDYYQNDWRESSD